MLIFLGALAWLPYAIQKYVLDLHVIMAPYLAAHLFGVVPGMLLRRGPESISWLKRVLFRRSKDFEHEL
jgi:hypothetical protein